MQVSNKILEKIQKCLNLSKSSNPGEAANALRMAQAMMKIMDNDTYRKELSLNARQVVSTYSEETVMAKWIRLFNSLVEK